MRRRLFWVLYGLGLLFFLLYFFGQYLLAFAEAQGGDAASRNVLLVRGTLRHSDSCRWGSRSMPKAAIPEHSSLNRRL